MTDRTMTNRTMTNLWTAIHRRRVLTIAIGVLLVAGVATSAVVFSLTPGEPAKAANTTNPPAHSTPADFTQYRSEQAGFELAYPKSWSKKPFRDPTALLVASPDAQDALLIRAFELPKPIEPQELSAAKQLTDQMVTSDKAIQMIGEPKQVELGGLPGFLYTYSRKDPHGQQEGVHSHFVLFNGKTAITLLFQALPADHFPSSAPTINKVISTFHVLKK